MSDVLSQTEIDVLLSAISTGEMDAEELKKEEIEKKEKAYDFKRALRFSKDQVRSLTRINENFARLLTSYFSAQLRTYVQISVASVDQLPYEEFVRSIPSMTILNIFLAPPLEGSIIIEVNPNIAYAMLDRQLGGKGLGVNKIDNLTEIETTLMSQLFEGALDTFKGAWSSVVDVNPSMLEFETNPQFLQMVSPNETVIVISLLTTIGESSGMINICLPHVALEPVIQKLSMHYWMSEKKHDRSPEDFRSLQKRVNQAGLAVKAELGSSQLTVNEFLNLEADDVVKLHQKVSEPVVIKIGEQPKFLAQPGKRGGRLALQIMEVLVEGDDNNE
ncbi:flagellar motor switch protein FliM [Scopulibacillus darangshiensis]|uniref:Flagellar motor switch protein FliM n=1 Tax=Scopulibacillus darangshiensis TaxID=442528 RepID=A0A4R2P8G9_9BACL|nr:flagellar motor switch protein FliM [Scopulibacillus darangshiensis]TCP30321.1 flagellar motor switch protein FliM [Scopulibacillus darangshiensis]